MLLQSRDTYFDDAPRNCIMLCPFCPDDDEVTPLVAFRPFDEQVRCERCRRTYRVVTRRIGGVTRQEPRGRDDGSQVRYRLLTDEPSGRQALRSFAAQPGGKLLHGHWVSLVWHHARLMGVANQSEDRWLAAGERSSLRSPYRPAAVAAFAVATLLAAGLMVEAAVGLLDVVVDGGLPERVLVVAVLGALLVPFVRWLLTPMRVRRDS